MKIIVTGGLGFIGSNLVKQQLSKGHDVTVIDDLSTGSFQFLSNLEMQAIKLINKSLVGMSDSELISIVDGATTVFHIAANADVRGGWKNSFRDIEQNIIATHKIANASRDANVEEFIFTSTGCVYGDSTIIPTPESEPFPVQTSLYGASKVAAEGILSSYAANDAFKVTVFRFVSVLGKNYHHGHVIDFVRKLIQDPSKLEILGDGNQKKSYINVLDCIQALVSLRGNANFEVFNIGQKDYIDVKKSAQLISKHMKLNPTFEFGKSNRGWIGDNPFTFLDISKAMSRGWSPEISIEESIEETVNWILANDWVINLEDKRNEKINLDR